MRSVITGFALLALAINFLLRKRRPLKDEPYEKDSSVSGKDIRCDCGRDNCCAIE